MQSWNVITPTSSLHQLACYPVIRYVIFYRLLHGLIKCKYLYLQCFRNQLQTSLLTISWLKQLICEWLDFNKFLSQKYLEKNALTCVFLSFATVSLWVVLLWSSIEMFQTRKQSEIFNSRENSCFLFNLIVTSVNDAAIFFSQK